MKINTITNSASIHYFDASEFLPIFLQEATSLRVIRWKQAFTPSATPQCNQLFNRWLKYKVADVAYAKCLRSGGNPSANQGVSEGPNRIPGLSGSLVFIEL